MKPIKTFKVPTGRVLPIKEVSRETGFSVMTLRQWKERGAVQVYKTPGGRLVFLDVSECQPQPTERERSS